ncbi:preprotein translocase subunit SecE [Photobacterium iliopiscarium]|jgi:preprotein translocase subunit SecE|uniref:Protein translocase subunit SecE n=1 Tax=Photobacterium iliopiscarium TaxID=56192 RepID=A0A0D8PL43_9GAMM|nr:preprotein translocase subunit SecE [Photobacterium iliopiscarium]KJG19343.1 preprotein translocase subunit SecE [Photobacterium iliopiscarium]PST88031.1 preprotein translocase subunit SecE [Photobacterium iliopiscarium]PST96849.1 preprotein translocase subunit SecE [Photobacterium iliopiscarium]PSV80104.1 preprotein translocase subunit SecE [Photobacterium iliopiscarium]PSV93460.1 preprotein translocase subunit SecE [Photobacterium iliopiscarium]
MKANAENQESESKMDGLKWVVVFALLAAAVVGNYLYSDVSVVLRSSAVVALVVIAGIFAALTAKGKSVVTFARESRMEVRKVVWPTRQEATQTTFIVLAVTIVMALALWGIDGVMVRLVRLVTGA